MNLRRFELHAFCGWTHILMTVLHKMKILIYVGEIQLPVIIQVNFGANIV